MNEKASELGLETHALRRSVRPAVGQRRRRPTTWRALITHAVAGRAHLVDHAHQRVHGLRRRQAADHRSAAPTTCCAAATSTCGREDRVHHARPATAWRRCCACRRAPTASRWSCSARARTRAASWNRATCSTGRPRKPRRSSPPSRSSHAPAAAVRRNRETLSIAEKDFSGFVLRGFFYAFLSMNPLHRRRIERQRRDRIHRDHHLAAARCGRRTPLR